MLKIRHRVMAASLALVLGLSAVGLTSATDPSPLRQPLQKATLTQRAYGDTGYFLYLPDSAPDDRPVTVLAAFGGIGDDPEQFARSLLAQAEERGWLLLVPRFTYGDWKQIANLRNDDRRHMVWLNALLDVLPEEAARPLRDRVLLYGFSRGGQTAHRFAMAYPERVLGVATMSGGTYTLPLEHSAAYDNHAALDFPVGVADLKQYCGRPFDAEALRHIPFWVGVGERDNAAGDVPRQWDAYLGTTRVERATAFAKSLSDLGVRVELSIVPRIGHEETAESRIMAVAFLQAAESERDSSPSDQEGLGDQDGGVGDQDGGVGDQGSAAAGG